MSHFEHMRRCDMRIQLDIIARAIPQIAAASEKIMHLESLMRIQTKLIKLERHMAGTGMMRIEIHNAYERVGPVAGLFAVADDIIMIGVVKQQVAV